MPDASRIDHWLDLWEQILEQGRDVSLEQFVQQYCQAASPAVIAAFRSQADALRSMAARLKEVGSPGQSIHGGGSQETTSLNPAAGVEPIPGYRLEERLGKGGFGEVWRATAPGGMPIALKFVPLAPHFARVERRGLDLLKQVRHPHLLATIGIWEQGGTLIIAMELADGTLLGRLRECQAQGLSGIPGPELLGYLAEAAKGLDYLNAPRQAPDGTTAAGIQHRDVKPHNLMLVGGCVKVGDFGLARWLRHEVTGHSRSGYSLPYAAPEFFDDCTTAQSDQYSLAVTYCNLRGGRLPFTGTDAQIMKGHLTGEPDLSMLPPEEHPVVARALAKEPAQRWPSCGAFVDGLRDAQPKTQPEDDAEKLRLLLLEDLNNRELRARYLAVRSPGLAIKDYNELRFSPWKMLLGLLVMAVCMLLGEVLAQQGEVPVWLSRLVLGACFVGSLFWLYREMEKFNQQRRHRGRFGPLPSDCPLDETEVRQRFLAE